MNSPKPIRMALIGGGMFGGDVVLRTIEDLERCGLAPYLGRVGLDDRARRLAPLEFSLVAIATRTSASAERLVARYRTALPSARPIAYSGETPWVDVFARNDIDLAFIATPDSLHHAPTIHALRAGAHCVVEKPLTLRVEETDEILREARDRNLVVGVDMHKRYDPCHRFIFETLLSSLGTPLYGRAVLEEPLEVSTEIFRWAATSNPFSYVGVHWVDLFGHYLRATPVSLHAVGQQELLANWDREGGTSPIRTFDAMQVAVDYASGLRVDYVNHWINPKEFEGAVNQEMELTGTRGKVEFDQQDRGLRAVITDVGTKTFNPHFTRDIPRPSGDGAAYNGYGKDSIVAIVERAMEVRLGWARRDELRGTYPDAESSRVSVAILEAAAEVATRNLASLRAGRGTPVTARFTGGRIEILDPDGTSTTLYDGAPFDGE